MRLSIGILALMALMAFLLVAVRATEEDEEDQMSIKEEIPEVKNLSETGQREYLSPNLVGLQTLASSFLPWRLVFVNIIDAYREVVNGVRYEILLNAIDTQQNGTDPSYLICRIVILEKPWLYTIWASKVRELVYSNCSSESDNSGLELYASDKYDINTIYNDENRRNRTISSEDLKKLDEQIIPKEETASLTDNIELVQNNTSYDNNNNEGIFTTEAIPYLTNDKLNLPNNSQEQGNKNLEAANSGFNDNDAYATEQKTENVEGSSLRKRRSNTLGGPKELNNDIIKEKLNMALDKSGEGNKLKVSKVHYVTSKVVSGVLIKANCDLTELDTGDDVRCKVNLWLRPWLEDSGEASEITIDCPEKPHLSIKRRYRRSVDNYLEKKNHKKFYSQSYLNKTEHLFNKFQLKFKRKYHTEAERQMRFRIFKRNLKLIEDLNRFEMGSAKYGLTVFADLTSEEYRMRTGLLPLPKNRTTNTKFSAHIPDLPELPKEFDWRSRLVVTPVKNQGLCGSCWAFSVTGNIESLHAIKTGKLQSYSEQELLDCDTSDKACMGGIPDTAFDTLSKIGGLELESDYPYHAHKEHCNFNPENVKVRVRGHVDLAKDEETIQKWLITKGPVSIGLNANAMQFYRGGVSHPWKVLCSPHNLDHGVLIVGYGVSEYPNFNKVLPYWIIKNSWGPKWGEQGYYRLYRGTNACGVSEMASSAVLED